MSTHLAVQGWVFSDKPKGRKSLLSCWNGGGGRSKSPYKPPL